LGAAEVAFACGAPVVSGVGCEVLVQTPLIDEMPSTATTICVIVVVVVIVVAVIVVVVVVVVVCLGRL